MPKGWVSFCGPFIGVILSPFPLLSFIFYLKPSTCTCIVFLLNKLLDKPTSCVETETRWETRDWGWGLGICGLLFQEEGVCLKAGNSREVQDENENSRGGLLDGGATFISYNWPKRCAFSPFFLLCPTPTVPFRLLPSRLLKKRRGSVRNCGSKGGLP